MKFRKGQCDVWWDGARTSERGNSAVARRGEGYIGCSKLERW